jgi:hypothetical protein
VHYLGYILVAVAATLITWGITNLNEKIRRSRARDVGFEEGWKEHEATAPMMAVEPEVVVSPLPSADEARERVALAIQEMNEDTSIFLAGLAARAADTEAGMYVHKRSIDETTPIPAVLMRETVRELIVQP